MPTGGPSVGPGRVDTGNARGTGDVTRRTRREQTPRRGAWNATIGVAVLGALAVGLAWSPEATAAPRPDAAFTIANYPVDARAKDAVKAKERALAEGQQAAFRSLLKRIVPVSAYNRIARLKTAKAADLVEGVSVRSEQNSSTQYIASLDFSFSPQAVRELLRREGVPFVDNLAPQIVLVPVLRDSTGGTVRTDSTWSGSWSGLDLENTLTPVKLEALKPSVHADTLKMLEEGNGGADRILAGEYNTERLIVAIAELDPAAKRLNVTLAGTDAVGPFRLKRSYRTSRADTAYAMELAAVVALGVLEGRWKATQAVSRGGDDGLSGPGSPVSMEVEFQSLAQWNDIRRELLDTPGVEDLRIGGVTARSADLSLRYPGGPERLADALAGRGLTLRSTAGGWSLRQSF